MISLHSHSFSPLPSFEQQRPGHHPRSRRDHPRQHQRRPRLDRRRSPTRQRRPPQGPPVLLLCRHLGPIHLWQEQRLRQKWQPPGCRPEGHRRVQAWRRADLQRLWLEQELLQHPLVNLKALCLSHLNTVIAIPRSPSHTCSFCRSRCDFLSPCCVLHPQIRFILQLVDAEPNHLLGRSRHHLLRLQRLVPPAPMALERR